MKNKIIWSLILILLLSSYVYGVAVTNCGTFTNPGEYILSNSVTNASTCFTFSANDVTLDCGGYTITYGTGGSANTYGVYAYNNTIYNKNNLTIKNCIMRRGSVALANNYGINVINYNNTYIYNNSIMPQGTTNNYPIRLLNTTNTIIDSNILFANGTTSSNMGIYVDLYCTNTTITNNRITTGNAISTTLNHGIYMVGNQRENTNNLIQNNNITTNGTGISNHGIYLNTNVSYTNINNNIIISNGKITNYGIYATAMIKNVSITNNLIKVYSNQTDTSGGFGVYLSTSIFDSNITGNTINVTGSTVNHGVVVLGVAGQPVNNIKINNNNIYVWNNLTAAATSYGIELTANANYNTVNNNNIFMVGGATDYGIYLLDAATTPSIENVVDNNTMRIEARGANNYGIYGTNSWNYMNITNNRIWVNGTTTQIGIYLLGVADATMPTIAYNNIINNTGEVYGTATTYGMYLSTNFQYNTVDSNNFYVNATTTPMGLYLLGASAANSDLNTITNNAFRVTTKTPTVGASNGYGSLISSGVNENVISGNNWTVDGSTACYGVQFLSTAALDMSLNVFANNKIYLNCTYGQGATTYGLYLFTNTNENIIDNNRITVAGNITTYGIYMSGATYPVLKNYFSYNTVDVSHRNSSTASGTNIMGIYGLTNSNQNEFYYNNITVNARTTGFGIRFDVSSDNILENNRLTVTNTVNNVSEGIYLSGNSQTNTFKDNVLTTVTGTAISLITSGYRPAGNIFQNNQLNNVLGGFDFYMRSQTIDDTQFINQPLNKVNFTGKGGTIVLEDTNYGKITFTQRVNNSIGSTPYASWGNFSSYYRFADDYIFVNASANKGMNRTATLVFYNVPVFTNATAYRDGIVCTATYCGALTNLGGNQYSVPVYSWSYYQILNQLFPFPFDCNIPNILTFKTTETYCDILNKTRNSLIANPVYTSFATVNLSATCSMDISESVLAGDLMCDLIRYSKKSLHDLLNANITNGNFSYNSSNTSTLGMVTSYQYS
jgi:hypothetical protein